MLIICLNAHFYSLYGEASEMSIKPRVRVDRSVGSQIMATPGRLENGNLESPSEREEVIAAIAEAYSSIASHHGCTKSITVDVLSEQPAAKTLLRDHVTRRSVRPEAARCVKIWAWSNELEEKWASRNICDEPDRGARGSGHSDKPKMLVEENHDLEELGHNTK